MTILKSHQGEVVTNHGEKSSSNRTRKSWKSCASFFSVKIKTKSQQKIFCQSHVTSECFFASMNHKWNADRVAYLSRVSWERTAVFIVRQSLQVDIQITLKLRCWWQMLFNLANLFICATKWLAQVFCCYTHERHETSWNDRALLSMDNYSDWVWSAGEHKLNRELTEEREKNINELERGTNTLRAPQKIVLSFFDVEEGRGLT